MYLIFNAILLYKVQPKCIDAITNLKVQGEAVPLSIMKNMTYDIPRHEKSSSAVSNNNTDDNNWSQMFKTIV